VVLSRVKALKGLFLQIPIWITHNFTWDNCLVQMLTRMSQKNTTRTWPRWITIIL
jgi:hypothetical protein